MPLESAQPFGRRKLKLLADQRLIDARRPRRRCKLKSVAGRAQHPV
jgi:hypothetical protein